VRLSLKDKKLLSRKDKTMRKQNRASKIVLVSLLILLFSGTPAFAQKSPKDKFVFPPLNPIQMPRVEKVTLANGLTLFLVENHQYPTIDLRAMVRTGSVFEPLELVGLAAICGQTLRTGGTTSMSGDEMDKELETMAATISAGIGLTSGYITVSLLKEDIDRVLEILADILMNPAFAEEKINLAKIEQKTMISRRNDEILQITFREFQKLIYGKESPYARHPEYATIEAVTRQDVVDFYRRYFHPNNTIMAIWGDFESQEMVAKIKKNLEAWEKKEVSIPSLPKIDYEYKLTVNHVQKPDVNQSNIMIGHIGGMMNNPDFPALSVMNSILSFDRMFKRIRTDEGLAYSVYGYYGAGYMYPGVFRCGAQTKSESTVYAIELMLEEMERMTEEEVSDEELAKAKDEYLNSFVFNFDSRAKIVNRMMTYAYFGYPLDFMEKVKEGVERVTKADVLRVAKKYLRPEKVQILVVGKEEDFDRPLSTLGEVNTIDITIPSPKPEKEKMKK
jgi:predicted Zn-dependent peptidase